jgi:ketosteroid isomerase-like protein
MGEKQNEEIARRAVEAWNAGDWDRMEALNSPQIEIVAPKEWPEGGTFSGWDAVRRQFERLKDSWSVERYAIDAVESAGDKVLVVGRWIGTGEASGLDLDLRLCFIDTIEGDRIIRVEYYLLEDDARRAFSMEEEGAGA